MVAFPLAIRLPDDASLVLGYPILLPVKHYYPTIILLLSHYYRIVIPLLSDAYNISSLV